MSATLRVRAAQRARTSSPCFRFANLLGASCRRENERGFLRVTLRVVSEEKLRRVHVKVLVGGEDVEITWATRNELLKLLQRAAGTLQVVLYLENVGTLRPVDLDRDGKEHLFRALTYWQDHPATR